MRPTAVQIIAHQDDDLLFMNPEVSAVVKSHTPTVSVFLTAGESSTPPEARSDYVRKRKLGSMAAYASMAGLPSRWVSDVIDVWPGRKLERWVLAPNVAELIFFGLPDGNDPYIEGGKGLLSRLQHDTANTISAEVVEGPGELRVKYRRIDVINTLAEIMRRYQPGIVRTLDPSPDARYANSWPPYNDHPDHVMAARFTQAAVRQYAGETGNTPYVVYHRCYNIEDAPVNISAFAAAEKQQHFTSYAVHDYKSGETEDYRSWQQRAYRRYQGAPCIVRSGNGDISVFLSTIAGIAYRRKKRGGRWEGVFHIPHRASVLAPDLTVAEGADGNICIFSMEVDTGDILCTTKNASAGSADWGTARLASARGQHAPASVPVPIRGHDDSMMLFARNHRGGISMLAHGDPLAEPGQWRDIGGDDVQESPAVAVDAHGRLHVFGATRRAMLHWTMRSPGTMPVQDAKRHGPVPSGGPTISAGPSGCYVLYSVAGENKFALIELTRDGLCAPPQLFPAAGISFLPSMVDTGHGLAVSYVDSEMRVRVRYLRGGGAWDLAPAARLALSPPAAGSTEDGALVLATVGPAGHLIIDEFPAVAELV